MEREKSGSTSDAQAQITDGLVQKIIHRLLTIYADKHSSGT